MNLHRSRAVVVLVHFVLLASCGDDPTGSNEGGPIHGSYAEVEASPTELSFSPLPPGDSETLSVTIRNKGEKDLKLKNVFIVDAETPFTVTSLEVDALAGGETTAVSVTYTSQGGNPDDTVLIIDSNAASDPILEIPISVGTALSGLLILPSPIDFGEVLGGEAKPLSVSIRNMGSATTEIMNVYIELGSSEDFDIIEPPTYPVSIPGGGNTYVDILYTPVGQDPDEGTLVVAYNESGAQALEKVPIHGREVGPELSISPPKVEFGWVAMGANVTETLSVHNMGEHDLKISKVYVAPLSNEDIHVVNAPSAEVSVKSGEKLDLELSFSPTEFFVTTTDPIGGIVVESNDADEGVVNVPVYANIDAPFIKADPSDKVDFGIVAQGWTIERTLVLQNVGHAPLTIEVMEITENSAAVEFTIIETGEGTLEAEEQIDVILGFTNDGAASGTELGKLHVKSDDPLTPDLYIELSALRGGLPECKLALVPGKLNFGIVAHGSQDQKTMFIKNAGSGYCSWGSGTIKECISFMGLMTTCSEDNKLSSEFTPTGMPIPIQDGLAPGTAQPVQILYTPPTSIPWIPIFEEYYAVFQVTYNEFYSDPDGGATQHTFPVADQMGNLQWNIHGSSGVADIAVLPPELDFGLVTIGCYSQAIKTKVYNAGTAPLDVTDIYLDGCGPEFQVVDYPELPLKIQPSQYAELCVVYLPQNEGVDSCHLLIESSDLDSPTTYVPLSGEGTWDTEHTDYFTQISGKKVDILFVVDESGSMCGEQDNLAANFSALTSIAAQWGNDYQIGITTTNIQDEEHTGKLYGEPRIINLSSVGKFAQNMDSIGCGGSGTQESGLEAGRRALTPPHASNTDIPCNCGQDQPCPGVCSEPDLCVSGFCGGYNRGFVRPDAALEVVLISDEEDQSPGSVPFYIDFFKSIKGFVNDDMFHAHAIVGDKNGGCKISQDEGADAGKRYIEVQEATGGEFGSICDQDFSQVLQDIGNKAFGLQKGFYLSAQADGSPGNIKVWVDSGGGYVECSSGWVYDVPTNSVIFDPAGSCMPEAGDEIKVWYKMVCNNENTIDCD